MSRALREKLDKITQVFDISNLQSVKADGDYIRRYYLKNKIPYSIFHTKQGLIHMGISRDGNFKEEDLLEPVLLVDKYIGTHKAKNVLELATGRGANSFWLAQKHPTVHFRGIDFSEGQISYAYKFVEQCQNFQPELGDFHDLTRFADGTFDVVFIIESLCYSSSVSKVLTEVQRVLRDDGYFVIWDGYLGDRKLSDDEMLAAEITGRGMAVAEFSTYSDFKQTAQNTGFVLEEEEDVSKFVIPTMRRFEKLAERFFKYPTIARFLARMLPHEFTYNSVSGMLMPILFESKVFEYWGTVFKNGNTSQ